MDLLSAETIGYVASILIILAVSRTSILHLRLLGLIGSIAFLIYGLVIGAYPVAVSNLVLAGLHAYFLFQLLGKRKEFFTTLQLHKESRYLRHFLDFHSDDIRRHQPEFTFEPRDDQIRAFILRDVMPAGVFVGRRCPDDSIEIELDYVVPQYRDFKVARFLYSDRSAIFGAEQDRAIWTKPGDKAHVDYFTKLGFERQGRDGTMVLAADLDSLIR